MLNDKHRTDLRASALTDATIAKYKIESLTAHEIRLKLGREDIDCGGWIIPYPDSHFFKIRLDKPSGDRKYLSPAGMSQDIFITHTAKAAMNDVSVPLSLVEGEKKAAALEQMSLAVISVPGVWGFKTKGHSVEGFVGINLKGRICRIIFDSDKYSNRHVCKAEFELAKFLRRRGAIVEIVNLPAGLGKGIDDMILKFTQDGNLSDLKKDFLESPQSYEDYIKARRDDKSSASIYTDLWNAEKFVELYGEDIRWCQALKSWFVWNDRYWQEDPGALRVEKLAKAMTKEMMKSEDKDLLKHAKASQNKYSLAAMIELAKSEDGIAIEVKDFDRDDFLLNCSTGIIDLKTGALLPHDREKYITRMTNTEYAPEALCPKWEWFVSDIFDGNQNIVNFMGKATGYALTGSTGEHCFFIGFGSGRNGKGTYLDTIRTLMGPYASMAPVSTLMTKPGRDSGPNEEIASLRGKRLVMASESEHTKVLSEGTIKALTGDRTVSTRMLYGHQFEYEQTAKIFLATNHKPKIRGTDEGIWSRPRLIPFKKYYAPEKRIKDLDKWFIDNEAPGILAWAVRKCLLWQKEGLGTVLEIEEATAAYRGEENFVGRFADEVLIKGDHLPGESTPLVYERFVRWAKAGGAHFIPDIRNFTQSMEALGFKSERRSFGPQKGRMFWMGISFAEGENAFTGDSAFTHESASEFDEQ